MAESQIKEDSSDSDYSPSDSDDSEENVTCEMCGVGHLEDFDGVGMESCEACGEAYCLDCAKTHLIKTMVIGMEMYFCHECFEHRKSTPK